jgi:hypothetical protein
LKLIARNESGASAILINREDNTEKKAIHKIFTFYEEVPEIYIIDDKATEIMDTDKNTRSIPVGIRALDGSQITLTFAGLNTLTEKVALYDAKENRTIVPEESNYTYSFINDGTNQDNRFFLLFSPNAPTGFDEVRENELIVHYKENTIRVISSPLHPIRSVKIYNMQGQLISTNNSLSAAAYNVNIPAKGIYLVDVVTGNARIVKKIFTY